MHKNRSTDGIYMYILSISDIHDGQEFFANILPLISLCSLKEMIIGSQVCWSLGKVAQDQQYF